MSIESFFERIQSLHPTGYNFDSRLVKRGEVFLAIKGERVDGNDYVQEAIQKGAVAAIVDRKSLHNENQNILYVEDVKFFLQQMARYKIRKVKPFIIGITGSVGKTTTKEFIYQLLSSSLPVVKPLGSFNSQITLPITILNFPENASIYLLEMGISKVGEMDRLVDIATPDIGIITNISHSHIEYFGSKEAIAEEKSKILTSKAKLQLVHISAAPFLQNREITTYGLKGSKSDIEYEVNDNQVRLLVEDEITCWIELPFNFPHFIENAVVAIILARYFGLSTEQIQEQAKCLQSYEHRCQIINKKGLIFFDDCYNASDTSFKAAIASLPKPKQGGKTIAVIGSVKEQGRFSFETHQNIANDAINVIDQVICKGEEALPVVDLFKKNNKPAYYADNREDLLKTLRLIAKEGDVILVKGSRSHALWEIIEQF